MILEFESQVPGIPDYNSLISLCVDIFSNNTDRKFIDYTVSIVIVSESTIQNLNFQYRGKDSITDVLSFNLSNDYNNTELILGEIFICYNKVLLQAQQLGHGVEYEIASLCIHGLCHLIGYDHQNDDEYEIMRAKEKELLKLVEKHYSFS
jgi:probable rRNA maturation factor